MLTVDSQRDTASYPLVKSTNYLQSDNILHDRLKIAITNNLCAVHVCTHGDALLNRDALWSFMSMERCTVYNWNAESRKKAF